MTETRTALEELELLAEKVTEGCSVGTDILARRLASKARDKGDLFPSHDVTKAFHGSLDAAKALHDAVLPGWGYDIDEGLVTVSNRIVSRGLAGHRSEWAKHDSNPARGWLLAILKALIEQEKAND